MTNIKRPRNRWPLVPAANILVAAILLGLAYNQATPLGVRLSNSDQRGFEPPVTSNPDGYFNQTLAMSLEAAAPPADSGGLYRNETVSLSLASVGATGQPGRKAIPVLNWAGVKPLLQAGKIVLVDARASSFYQADHIPGAISLPVYATPPEFAAFQAKYPRHTPLVVYCGTPQCPLGHHLAAALIEQFGYTNVSVMPGGYAEYRLAEAQATAATTGPRQISAP